MHMLLQVRNWETYIVAENVLIKCSMKHKLHHNTIVTSLTHCCIQCNNVTVVQFRNLRFLLQFKRNSANVAKNNSINIILPEMHSNTVSQLGYQMKAHHLRQIVHFCLEQTQIIQLLNYDKAATSIQCHTAQFWFMQLLHKRGQYAAFIHLQ